MSGPAIYASSNVAHTKSNAPNLIDLDELRDRTPLLPLIQRHVTLKRTARLWSGCCPFHRETTPSFKVYPRHYHCYGCGAHGDAIAFVRNIEGLSLAEAVARLAAEAGIDASPGDRNTQRERVERIALERADREAQRVAAEVEKRATEVAKLRRRVRRTVGIAGTLAERYLTETRGIPRPLDGWPEALRFDPHARALVIVATGDDGAPQAAQWVHLASDATKAPPTEDRPTKQTRGSIKGAAVRLPGRSGALLLVAEGPETGLSLWVSTGCETWIALGSIGNLPTPPVGREVVACLDDDARHKPAGRQARKTLACWKRAGVRPVVAKPWVVRREDGSDFNDLLREHGTGAVEERVLFALAPGEYRARRPVPVSIARERLRQRIAAEADAVISGNDATETAIGMGAGGGKSEVAIREATRVVRAFRARGDLRTVAIATPRHDLNDKHAERANAAAPDITVAVYRGADADDPDAPGQKMCRNRDDRRAAEIRRLDATQVICPVCPHREGCALLAQAGRRADIWFVPHNLLFLPKPRTLGEVAWLIVDENPIRAALIGVGDPLAPDDEDRPLLLTLDTLRRGDRIKGDPTDTERLAAARLQGVAAADGSPDARLMRAALIDAGLTTDAAEQAIGLEYATRIVPVIDEGMPLPDRMEVLRACDANADLSRRVMFWREVAALLRSGNEASARVEVVTQHGPEGSVRAIRLKGSRTIKAGWQVRTTILDATLQPNLLREIWPEVVVHDVGLLLDAPHRHIVQVVDRAFSLAMLDSDGPRIQDKERRRRKANLHRLHLTIGRQLRGFAPGRVLVVAQKRIVALLQAIGPLPGNVVWAHHGAVTGRDDWGGVRAVTVVGRSMPPPAAVERQAEALTGKPIARLPRDQWYPLVDAVRDLSEGSQIAAETVRHPDPVAEAFRWRACEGELVQIIERARGVNRHSDAQRVDVLVLTDVPLPLPVETTVVADDLTPRVEDRMLAAGGVVLFGSEHGAMAYPEIWRDGNTLRVHRHRERERANDTDWQATPGLRRVRYRLARNGSHHETALYDLACVPDIAAWLTDRLGSLADAPEVLELHYPPLKTSILGRCNGAISTSLVGA
jgi:putative DNA primase/helicase